MLKTPARFRSRDRQPKSFACIKFHSAIIRREENKLQRFLEEKLDAFLSIGNHQKNVRFHFCVASRIERNQSACVI